MAELLSIIPTSWATIRFGLYRRANSFYQFAEQHLVKDDQPDLLEHGGGEPAPEEKKWVNLVPSGVYPDRTIAERAWPKLTRYVRKVENLKCVLSTSALRELLNRKVFVQSRNLSCFLPLEIPPWPT